MKEDPSLSYFSALLIVIRAGCDNDENDTMNSRRHRSPHSSFRLANRRSQKSTPKRNADSAFFSRPTMDIGAIAVKAQEDQIGDAHGLSNFAPNTAPINYKNDPEQTKHEAQDDENIIAAEDNLASTVVHENDECFNETNQDVQSDKEDGGIFPSSMKEVVFDEEAAK